MEEEPPPSIGRSLGPPGACISPLSCMAKILWPSLILFAAWCDSSQRLVWAECLANIVCQTPLSTLAPWNPDGNPTGVHSFSSLRAGTAAQASLGPVGVRLNAVSYQIIAGPRRLTCSASSNGSSR